MTQKRNWRSKKKKSKSEKKGQDSINTMGKDEEFEQALRNTKDRELRIDALIKEILGDLIGESR